MGNCYKSKATEESVSYERVQTIFISRGESLSKFLPADKVKFKITDPIKQVCEIYDINNFKLRITSCVVPGQDPRGEVGKICQDNVLLVSKSGLVLISLFDGHGSKGEAVVDFVETFFRKYFLETDFSTNPSESLKEMFISCDLQIQRPASQINCYGSGTTVVSILFTNKGIYAASVGDSRGVLATLPQERYIPECSKTSHRYRTLFTPLRVLEPIQLTLDQKPNLEAELQRIIQSGGIVSKVKDSEGNFVGPYRVFQKGKQIPGLAMSRSIGDVAAKRVGVIAEPIINFYPIAPFRDQFILIGSDGVWDAIENSEAVNFVEKFRGKCLKVPEDSEEGYVGTDNSTIARLLVEEARYRWLGLCCQEDVLIDDISSIVVEISASELISEVDDFESRISLDTGSYLEFKSEHTVSQASISIRDTLADTSYVNEAIEEIDFHSE